MGTLNRNRQWGGMGSIIFWVLLFGVILTLGSRLGPLYLDNNTMSGILDAVGEEAGMGGKSDRELYSILEKRFKLNQIREFDIQQHIQFERTGSGTDMIMDYEVRMPLMANIDMIASFEKTVNLRD